MVTMVETDSMASVSESLTLREWAMLGDAARDAALTLLMASEDGVHEHYRPPAAQVADAKRVLAKWRAVCRRPLPEDEPQFVAPRAQWSAPVVINLSADWCP